MDRTADIDKQISRLADDHIHGANWLSIQAIRILKAAISDNQVQTTAELLDKIYLISETIVRTRPNMISISNYVTQFLEQLSCTQQIKQDLKPFKRHAADKAGELITKIKKSALKAAINGANIVEDKDTIISCSYSNTLCEALQLAKQRTIEFNLIIAESRFRNKIYGRLCAKQLEKLSIQSMLISDESIRLHISNCDKVMVGADTILLDGSLINGYPSYKLALFASKAGIPFYTICEIAKLDIHNHYDIYLKNIAGFDTIPPEMINGIVTEAGIIKPSEVSQYTLRYDN